MWEHESVFIDCTLKSADCRSTDTLVYILDCNPHSEKKKNYYYKGNLKKKKKMEIRGQITRCRQWFSKHYTENEGTG